MAFQYLESLIQNANSEDENESDVELDDTEMFLDDNSNPTGDDEELRPTNRVDLEPIYDRESAWSEELSNVRERMKAFTETHGGVTDLPEDSQPIDYFKLFLTDEMMELLVLQTNLYATQKQRDNAPDQYWKPATEEDVYKYIYVNIMFGLHILPETYIYWSLDPMWRVPAVADVIGRQRYCKIHQYFHANDSDAQPARGEDDFDPLYKVRPFLDHVRNVCMSVYKPSRQLSVDEAMIGFRGLLSFKQYIKIKGKPTPWGLKVWCCAEANTGYVMNFRVYTGKTDTASPNGLGYDVVMSMTEYYLDKNQEVFFDNFFASTKLATDLLMRDTYSCSTIRSNRKGWPYAASKQAKDDVKMCQKGMMVATQWTDKRQVNLLSTNSNPEMVTMQRRSKTGYNDVLIPAPVESYNSGMFGVDLSDQHRSYYPVGRSSIKWWRYLFWYLIQVSIINAYLLMKDANPNAPRRSPARCQLLFRQELLKGLLKLANPSRKRQREAPTVGATVQTPGSQHSIITMTGRKRACIQCSADGTKMASGRTRESTTGCQLCQVHLHKGLCFTRFHERL